jgi:hypothetical protein
MTRLQYWTLNLASLLLAALIGSEILMVHQLDRVATLVERAQAPLVQAQQDGPQIRALVQRTAMGAARDPALRDLLFKYGIALKIKPTSDAPASADAAGAPAPTLGAQLSAPPANSANPSTP